MLRFSSVVARWAVRVVTSSEMAYEMFLYVTHFRRRDEEKIMFAVNEGTSPAKVQNEDTVEANHVQDVVVQLSVVLRILAGMCQDWWCALHITYT